VVDAEYAFVLHTTNPVTGAKDEMMGEVVVGLGEALVGNHPGRALGFVVGKADGAAPAVARYPSKRAGLFLPAAGEGGAAGAGTLIFRSDSNGEDLEGFAGAGLYDSVMAVPAAERAVDYSEERLLFDDAFRADLLGKLAAAARAVEAAMGGVPQDIEGAVRDGVVYIVQTRPQVRPRPRPPRARMRGRAHSE
jgi:alpha-glucan, water dikinase